MSNLSIENSQPKQRRSFGSFRAVVRYELLWNLRKKKVLAMVIIAVLYTVLIVAVGPVLASVEGIKISANPDYVISIGGVNSFIIFLLALVTAMNSISGEFESGSIVPLLAKPVTRTAVFLGKLAAAVLTLTAVYILMYLITTVAGLVIYGPQNYLYFVPLMLIATVLSTMVWMSLVFAFSSVTKSSLFSAIGPFLTYIALSIVVPIVSLFSGAVIALTYLPGSGRAGTLVNSTGSSATLGGVPISVASGTDGLPETLLSYILHPADYVAFLKLGVGSGLTATSNEPLSHVLLIAIGVAFAYSFAFCFISWLALRRAQISE